MIHPRWNHRKQLMSGLRRRIELEPFGMNLLMLFSWLMDAGELPVR